MITFQRLGHHGRLGNQLFEYAALVGAATKLGVAWGIDFAKEHTANAYSTRGRFRLRVARIRESLELRNAFEITAQPAQATSREYREVHLHFDPSLFSIQDDTDLLGFFQSPKYFAHCEDVVRREFAFKPEIRAAAESILSELPQKPLVSLHIRRADYLVEYSQRRFVDLWPTGYYQRAMAQFPGDFQFVCISDDRAWCQKHLPRTVVCVDGGSPYVELCVMSRCQHHIIANSSFSWWGAWLNADPHKRVVCPQQWFGPAIGEQGVKDRYCDEWVSV